jgi:ABC-type multidrug transport system ATPase subunit
MDIILDNIGKRYRYDWIFKQLHFQFSAGQNYGVLGQNGAGKSTFLQLISGYLSASAGQIAYQNKEKKIERDDIYRYVAICAPYLSLVDEFNLLETIQFQAQFKTWQNTLSADEILELIALPKAAQNRPLRQFSSGMRQRVKLALAILSDAPLLLLDEPTITLDNQAISWFVSLLRNFRPTSRLVLIASNVESDFIDCAAELDLKIFK